MRNSRLGLILLGLFTLSGFAGLIYQSIWSHYLGLVLGHAAYAQTLVLAIFMGGMAIGAWLASRYSVRWRHLILAYAALEFAIGAVGLAFHPTFVAYLNFSLDVVLPSLGSATLAHAYQWTTGALLMLPQSILLGVTFPLLSAGYLRLAPHSPGEVLGGLYFTNSLGAALGALATAFVLLPAIGMPGTMMTAGLLNVLVAMGAWAVWKLAPPDVGTPPADLDVMVSIETNVSAPGMSRLPHIVLFAAFITGATSFVYEIGWVRLLNQALGTTIHSFELMLAAFILGLACGGYWISRRAARIVDVIRYAGYAQVLMGLAALMSVLVLAQSFRWVGWLMGALARNDSGYVLFSGGSAVVALLVMFPAAFFAGMTLPLFTLALLRAGGGERQIGRVYASNTLGAIIGVLVMVHLLVPLMGVRLAIILSALIDAALGLYLLRCVSPGRRTFGYGMAAAATLAFTVVAVLLGRHDPAVLAAGVFRTGNVRLANSISVPFFRDGKTATVSVAVEPPGAATISTNGKPDASLSLQMDFMPSPDEVTMIMAGALPLALHPAPKHIAVIGWGSGLTTQTLLGSPIPSQVDTIEIERAMYDGARLFGKRVERAYTDPRSRLHVDDARTYFAMGNRKFDVIVSEPSNPWVSGVASLFTTQFYQFLHGHLAEDGLLVQWLQAYELNDELMATMIAALLQEFPDSDIYLTNDYDLLIVGYKGERAPAHWDVLKEAPLHEELKRVGLGSPAAFHLRRIGGPLFLRNYVRVAHALPHSDYFPVVSLNAPRARFKEESADSLLGIIDCGMPVAELLDGRVELATDKLEYARYSRYSRNKRTAAAIRQSMLVQGSHASAYAEDADQLTQVQTLLRLSSETVNEDDVMLWTYLVAEIVEASLVPLPPVEQVGVWIQPSWIEVETQPAVVVDILRALEAAARRDALSMVPTALVVLDYPSTQISPVLRELMLVQAELGAIATGDYARIMALEKKYGSGMPRGTRRTYARNFLVTWADYKQSETPGSKL